MTEPESNSVKMNIERVKDNINVIKKARWRLFRNRKLLDESWRLLMENERKLS